MALALLCQLQEASRLSSSSIKSEEPCLRPRLPDPILLLLLIVLTNPDLELDLEDFEVENDVRRFLLVGLGVGCLVGS